jgi:SsrA-binding protein
MTKKNPSDLVSNRKAFHDYEILETFEAGIVLTGTEIKSLRNNGGSLSDAYIIIDNYEMFLINSSIAPYQFGNLYNHTDKRKRKLLMHKNEIFKLKKKVQEKNLALIPLSLYLKKGLVKVKAALGKGKKSFDKRASLKEKEQKKTIAKLLKS